MPAHDHGVLVVDKPAGATSHDVVQYVRWALREKSVGHCGTLDPAATGVLVVCVGAATKLVEVLHADDKRYLATIALGLATTTGDAEGEPIARVELDDAARDDATRRACVAATELRGALSLPPPAFSAIKQDGVAAHVRARRGEAVELAPRTMTIHEVHVLGSAPGRIDVELAVGKGTYVRSWAVALGEAIGVPAHLARLHRVASGSLRLDDPRTVRGLAVVSSSTGAGKPRARIELAGAEDRERAGERLRAAMIAPMDALPPGWTRAIAPDPARFERLCQGLPQWAGTVGVSEEALPGPGAITDPAGQRLVLVRLEPQGEGLRVVPSRLLRLAEAPDADLPGA